MVSIAETVNNTNGKIKVASCGTRFKGVCFGGMIRGYDLPRSHLLPFEATQQNLKQNKTHMDDITHDTKKPGEPGRLRIEPLGSPPSAMPPLPRTKSPAGLRPNTARAPLAPKRDNCQCSLGKLGGNNSKRVEPSPLQ